MRILLVDSDTEARTAIVLWLDEFFAHVEIEAAASAAEAVIALRKGRTRHQSWSSPPERRQR